MPDFEDIWDLWYEDQLLEQANNKLRFAHEVPTLVDADPFDPSEDATVLREAMKGLGTNEDAIIDILTARTADQRVKIQKKYHHMYDRDLIKDLESEINGVFEKVIMSLMKPMALFMAEQIHEATHGRGTDETALIEIICTRDDESLKTVKDAFEHQYGKTVEHVIEHETHGHFKQVLLNKLSLCTDDSASTPEDVAEELCTKGVDEDDIIRICTAYTFRFLRKTFRKYEEIKGKEFQKLIDKKCSGDSKRAIEAIHVTSVCRPEFYARALHDAMEGFGTDDWALIRIIVSRCEIDMETVKEKYSEVFDKNLVHQIKHETSGDYEKTLLRLLGE